MYAICFYVPIEHLETVKKAMFLAGAGKYKNYDHCCWQTKGEGQFRPLEGSNPAIGQHDVIEMAEEYKVEMICDDRHIKAALFAMKEAHPFEQPAFYYWKINPELPN